MGKKRTTLLESIEFKARKGNVIITADGGICFVMSRQDFFATFGKAKKVIRQMEPNIPISRVGKKGRH
jgi:hypothetical protein